MTALLEGTRRFVVKRTLSRMPDTFAALPPELGATIEEVHFADGSDEDLVRAGHVGAYSIDLDNEFEQKFRGASNLLELVAVDSREMGEYTEHATSEEIEPMSMYLTDAERSSGPDTAATEKFWRGGPVTDQGREGACVGHAGTSFLTNAPVRSYAKESTAWLNQFAYNLYKTTQRNDEWRGENYSGTSVSALMRVLRAKGHIRGAVVTQSFEEIVRWKRTRGPLVLSAPWFEGCYVTDWRGFIQPTGRKVGGHALIDHGVSRWRTGYWKNSWGRDFGQSGIGYVDERAYRWWLNAGLRAYAAGEIRK